VAAEALEQSMLESKDKDQLLAIAQALGIKTNARAAKATLITKILETTGGTPAAEPAPAPAAAPEPAPVAAPAAAPAPAPVADAPAAADAPEVVLGPDGEPLADWEVELLRSGELTTTDVTAPAPASASSSPRCRDRSSPPTSSSEPHEHGQDRLRPKHRLHRTQARVCVRWKSHQPPQRRLVRVLRPLPQITSNPTQFLTDH